MSNRVESSVESLFGKAHGLIREWRERDGQPGRLVEGGGAHAFLRVRGDHAAREQAAPLQRHPQDGDGDGQEFWAGWKGATKEDSCGESKRAVISGKFGSRFPLFLLVLQGGWCPRQYYGCRRRERGHFPKEDNFSGGG